MKRNYKEKFINIIMPSLVFGFITGVLTALVITLYKFVAKEVIALSHVIYQSAKTEWYVIVLALVVFIVLAFVVARVYKWLPNLKGGGIPTSIGLLRGNIRFSWFKNLIGTFILSLTNFLIGVPLGNEGPSVQMGTAIGKGSALIQKRHRAWDRYAMTGGACAGFAVATGASVAGVMFAVEEGHQRLSPMIILVSAITVIFARITTELLSPIFGVSVLLFPEMELVALNVSDIWLTVLIGTVMGFFAVGFLYLYKGINHLVKVKLTKIPHTYKIFAVYLLCFLAGIINIGFVSTGHELILSLFTSRPEILILVAIIIVRSVLTLGANTNSLTGGIFLPILAIGASLSSLVALGLIEVFSLGDSYYTIALVLGITACISGMMKMPITAITFALETLTFGQNVLAVITVSAVAYLITELFSAKSINDSVLEAKLEKSAQKQKVIDMAVSVKPKSFAVGKQIRDILWPSNTFILSVERAEEKAQMDVHGARTLNSGDVLHVRFSTTAEELTKQELYSIVGEQDAE
ncbi:MAG: chloride channel protein [Clostridia bacterium]|nr:chloride channel protein [Clostridia bacterium]